jgi:hypothetical protein
MTTLGSRLFGLVGIGFSNNKNPQGGMRCGRGGNGDGDGDWGGRIRGGESGIPSLFPLTLLVAYSWFRKNCLVFSMGWFLLYPQHIEIAIGFLRGFLSLE